MAKIDKKLKKLLKVNNNDPTIKLKSSNLYSIDLFGLCPENKIKDFLLGNSVCLVIDKFQNEDDFNNLKSSTTIEEFLSIIDKSSFRISKINKELLLKNFLGNKEKVLLDIKDDQNRIIKIFQKISKEAETTKLTKNIETLYIGACFVKATFKYLENNLTPINAFAPIFCYPVKVETDFQKSIVKITKQSDAPCLNQKLFQIIFDEYNIKITDQQFDEEYSNNVKEFLTFLQQSLSKSINNWNINTNENIEKIQIYDYKLEEINPRIINNICLTRIEPKGNIIKLDIEEMIKQGVEDPFKINTNINYKEEYENYQIKYDDLVEINHPLNIYQKYAIQSALKEDTLIYGPPGTGKSEVIASIIANVINIDKTILISSEKRAALDVLQNRLGELGKICLFIYDSSKKEEFYNCLKTISSLLKTPTKSSENEKSKISQEKYNNLLELIDIFCKIQEKNNLNNIEDVFNLYKKIDKKNLMNLLKKILILQKISLSVLN